MDHVLIPGAGGRAWYWHLVAERLTAAGHRAVAVELPADDDTKGLADYAQAVLDAVGSARGVVLVAASLGAFTAPLVAGELEASAVVLVNPMIPLPGETPAAWWGNTGAVEAREQRASRLGYPVEFDPRTYMFHDVPPEVLASATPKGEQSQRPFATRARSPPCRPTSQWSRRGMTASSRSSSSNDWPGNVWVSNPWWFPVDIWWR
jgi:hypothetical protein